MQIAVLALQGAFIEHERMLQRLGVSSFEIRNREDLEKTFDGLIIPGGESTVQGKLLRELGIFEPLRAMIRAGLPTFGTCAGLLLLAKEIQNDDRTYLTTMDVTAVRNAYGRQLGSFHAEAEFADLGAVPMTFIRAPYIERVFGDAETLAKVDDHIVAARQGNQLVCAFHPELDDNATVHQYFLDMIRASA